jgi:hypothetical protein
MGVPDEFPHKTHKSRVITQRALTFDATGRASAIIGASLDRFITQEIATGNGIASLTYDIAQDGTATSTQSWHDENKVAIANLAKIDYDIRPYCFDVDNSLTQDEAHNKELEPVLLTTTEGLPAGSSGASFIEVLPCGASASVSVWGYTTDTTVGGWGIQAITYSAANQATTTNYGPYTGTGSSFSPAIVLPATAAYLGVIRVYRLTGTGELSGFKYAFGSGGVKQQATPLGREDGTDLALVKAGCRRYRIVAMSCWAMYNGAMTSNGLISCGQIPHADLASVPIMNSEELANIPGFYSGPLNKGGYSWMRPLDRADLAFEDISNPDGYGSRLAVAVRANDTDAQNVTLRVCAVIEYQTDNQVWGATRNIVDPPMIWLAQKELASFPTGMENDLHLKEIARKMLAFGKKAANFVQTYGPYALSALSAAEQLV